MKRKILTIALVFTLAFSGFLIFQRVQNDTESDSDSGINYGSPTDEEKSAGDSRKNEIINDQKSESDNEDSDGKKTVYVSITDASQYDDKIEVRAFIPDYLGYGDCKITFSKAELTLHKQASAIPDATSTICTNPDILASEFLESGLWTVKVVYSSDNAQGESAEQELEIVKP